MIRNENARGALTRRFLFLSSSLRPWTTRFCAVAQVALLSAPLMAQDSDDSLSTESATSALPGWLEGGNTGNFLLWGGALLVVVLVGWWMANIYASFARRRKYQDPQADEQPSVDERLLSELAPMEVALLRGNIDGFYQKVYSLMYQLLRSRKLIDGPQRPTAEVVECLRDIGVEPTFLDCVESLATRCDSVRQRGHKPTHEENLAMIKDLDTLIRMRPHATGRRRDRKRGDKASPKRNRPILASSDQATDATPNTPGDATPEQNQPPTETE